MVAIVSQQIEQEGIIDGKPSSTVTKIYNEAAQYRMIGENSQMQGGMYGMP